jgi:iron only hydrogenase large subunit-like protein
MPCYDKKLEASRQEFYNDLYSSRDVDCVITTGELEVMMREKGWDLSLPVEGEDCPFVNEEDEDRLPELVSHPGTSSGSYLHTLISGIIARSSSPLDLSVRTVRTADYEEYTLSGGDGVVVFKGAKCYGFRNLQNVVRKVGREVGVQVGRGAAGKMMGGRARKVVGESEKGYDYVEVMACPGGCVNGGGQVRPSRPSSDDDGVRNAKWGDKEWTKKVEEAYWRGDSDHDRGGEEADRMALRVLVDLCGPREVSSCDWGASMDDEAEERRRGLFRTEYRVVESEVVGLAVQW